MLATWGCPMLGTPLPDLHCRVRKLGTGILGPLSRSDSNQFSWVYVFLSFEYFSKVLGLYLKCGMGLWKNIEED